MGKIDPVLQELSAGYDLISFAAAMGGTVMQIIGPDKLKDLTNEIAKGLPALVNKMPVVGHD